MDPRERFVDEEESMRAAIEGLLAGTWHGGPGIIESYNATLQTVSVQPAVQSKWRKQDGTLVDITLPLLLDVPVQFPRGGGTSFTFPVAQGDECFFVIADRCMDAWWQNGGVQPQAELRMNDLSDAVAFLGFSSKPRALSNVSTTECQIRTDTGLTWVGVTPGQEKARVIAGTIYEWFCHQYGQKITWGGGKNYHIDTYDSDAIVTSTDHPLTDPGSL